MLRAVLDANVLVAAAIKPGGLCQRLVAAAVAGGFTLVVSPHLLAELEEVLRRRKFDRYLTDQTREQFQALVFAVAEHAPDPPLVSGLTADPDEDYLVVLAREVGADVLVSGDSHLTSLAALEPPVLTPRAFLARLG